MKRTASSCWCCPKLCRKRGALNTVAKRLLTVTSSSCDVFFCNLILLVAVNYCCRSVKLRQRRRQMPNEFHVTRHVSRCKTSSQTSTRSTYTRSITNQDIALRGKFHGLGQGCVCEGMWSKKAAVCPICSPRGCRLSVAFYSQVVISSSETWEIENDE